MAKRKEPIMVQTRHGVMRLLRPHEKSAKYAIELKRKVRMTNMGEPKVDRNGVALGLTKEGRAFRAGYLQARKDNTNYHNWMVAHNVGTRKRRTRRSSSNGTSLPVVIVE